MLEGSRILCADLERLLYPHTNSFIALIISIVVCYVYMYKYIVQHYKVLHNFLTVTVLLLYMNVWKLPLDIK